jgi:hypothetical protein
MAHSVYFHHNKNKSLGTNVFSKEDFLKFRMTFKFKRD